MIKKTKQIKCKFCGHKTEHYLTSKGVYRCNICNSVSNTNTIVKDIVFEPDFDLSDNTEEDLQESKTEYVVSE